MKKVLLIIALVATTAIISCETEKDETYNDAQATEKECGSSPGQKACEDN